MNFNEQHLIQFLNYKFSQLGEDEFVGLRILPQKNSGLKPQSGLYNDKNRLLNDIKNLSGIYNIYLCSNPLKFNPTLAINSYAHGLSFGDMDVVRYTTLYLDFDPKRKTGCASTDAEKQSAALIAIQVAEFLNSKGICLYFNSSGNGFSILINIPSYDINQSDKISKFLKYLSSMFSTENVNIDTSVSNPSRVMRCMGTLNMKGDSTLERPHRLATPLCDYTQTIPSCDILEIFKDEIINFVPQTSPILNGQRTQHKNGLGYSKFKNNIMTLDLVTLTKNKGMYVKPAGENMHIVLCPNRHEHSDNTDGTNSTVIFQDVFSQKIAFKCHHNHCQHINLSYLLNTYFESEEVDSLCSLPFVDLRNNSRPEIYKPDLQVKKIGFNMRKIYDVIRTPSPAYDYVLEDILIIGGLSFLAAQPKVGKTTFLRHLCKAVAHGELFLGKKTTKGVVAYLALEEHVEWMKKEFKKLGVKEETDIYIHAEPAPSDAVEHLVSILEEIKPVLLVIDTMQKLVRLSDLNDYAKVNNALEPILSLARKYNCHIILTHHMNKAIEGDNGRKILGSTAIFGACDTVIFLENKSDERVLSLVYRYPPVNPIERSVLHLNAETSELSLQTVREQKKQTLDSELLSLIGQHSEISKEKLLERAGQRKSEAIKALDRLTDEGHLLKSGSGRRGSPTKYKIANPVPSLVLKNGNENFDVRDDI